MIAERVDLERESDESLMLRCKRGDVQAFDILVIRHNKALTNFVYHFIGDYEDTKDIIQEIFLRIYRSAEKYQPTAKFTTWLYKIARNVCINKYRKKSKISTISLEKPLATKDGRIILAKNKLSNSSSTPEQDLLKKEIQEIMKSAINSLPQIYREIIILCKYQERSYEEVASILNIPERTVETRLYRAMKKLRGALNFLNKVEGFS